jgi:tetratricopeptide (TPR) repeat protein
MVKIKLFTAFTLILLFCGCHSGNNDKISLIESGTSFSPSQKIDSLSSLIQLDSLNADLYFQRAELLLKNKELNLGSIDLEKTVKLDPKNTKYWFKLGVLNFSKQESRRARDCWLTCSDLDSRNIDCRLNLAEMFLAIGELKKGQNRLNEILAFDPKNSYALFLTGNYALMTQDTTKAIKYIQSAINEDQDLFKAYDQLGVIYSSRKDFLAIDYFNSALRLKPNRFDVHYKVAMFYQSLGFFDEAIQAYLRVLELNSSHELSLHNLGAIGVFTEDYKSAEKYFSSAISQNASFLEAYFGRAYTYELMGDFLKSESDYRTSLMFDPAYLPSIEGLSRLESTNLN